MCCWKQCMGQQTNFVAGDQRRKSQYQTAASEINGKILTPQTEGRNVEAAAPARLTLSICSLNESKQSWGCERVDVTSVAGKTNAFHTLITLLARLIWADNWLEKACPKCWPLDPLARLNFRLLMSTIVDVPHLQPPKLHFIYLFNKYRYRIF